MAHTAEELYKAYEEYSKTLRTWLVAYGIGAPVLFLGNETAWKTLVDSGKARDVATLFLLGVAVQVLLAALNKTVLWVCYYGELENSYKSRRQFKICEWLSQQFWIDLVCDAGAGVLFALATIQVFSVLAPAS